MSMRMAAVAAAVFVLAACGGSGGGQAGTSDAPSVASSTTTSPEPASGPMLGLYVGTVSKADAEKVAPKATVDAYFPRGSDEHTFSLELLEGGGWREYDGVRGEEGDAGEYTIEGDLITFSSFNVPQLLTFEWSVDGDVLTLSPESSDGPGSAEGFFPDELLVMAHDWKLRS